MNLSVLLLRCVVELLLLFGTKCICQAEYTWCRFVLAAGLGGVYARMCMIPGWYFLGNAIWYLLVLVGIAFLAFGFTRKRWKCVIIFILMNLILDSVMLDQNNLWRSLVGLACLLSLCFLRFGISQVRYVPVELTFGDKKISITALVDTGNSLTDPVTGRSVIVIGAQAARELTGLTQEQLQKPVETVGVIPGLRLIPYNTIGKSGALMLAMRLKNIRIGNWKGCGLVAFAPECIGSSVTYQGLTGGL